MLRTWVEIDTQALRSNFRQFQRFFSVSVEIAPVVKANAYGHGTLHAAKTFARERIWGFCVASGSEALELRQWYTGRILVMSSWETSELKSLIRTGIALVAWDERSALAIDQAARRIGRKAIVHLKLDTGASRIGVRPPNMSAAIRYLRRLPHIQLDGIFSHFADSENNHRTFTRGQLEIFRQATSLAQGVAWKHIACTAAALRYPDSCYNLVRLGIGLYGLWPSVETQRTVERRQSGFTLRPVLSWRTKLLQVKELPAGAGVGYGLTFTTKRRTRLGIVPVGYWDGYDRLFSNRAQVLIRGQRAPVIGRVCMNLTMIDCTRINGAKAGETVTLLGDDAKDRLTAEDLARWANTINYEVVTRINPNIQRVVRKG